MARSDDLSQNHSPGGQPAGGKSPQKPSAAKLPTVVVVLGVVSFFTDASTEMIYPLIPVFVSLLGSGVIVLGVIEGIAEAASSALKLTGGVLSDHLRKKKLFAVAGYSISSLARLLTALVSRAWQIVPIRLADRIGKGLRTSPRDALLASSVEPAVRGRAFGFHRAMDHAGAVVGPILSLASLYSCSCFPGFRPCWRRSGGPSFWL
jgi:hypothetical protein